MSTKTTFKRVALVAVAALGLGVLTSVTPANAANAVGDTYALNSATLDTATTTYAARVGQEIAIPVTGSAAAQTNAATKYGALSIAATITSQPAGSAIYPTLDSVKAALGTDLDFVNAGLVYDTNATAIATGVSSTGSATAVATVNYNVGTDGEDPAAIAAGTTLGTVKFTLPKGCLHSSCMEREGPYDRCCRGSRR